MTLGRFVALAALAVIACAPLQVVRAQASPPSAQPRPDTTIVLRSDGTILEFDPARISVKTGKRVRIRYVNDGSLPHNFVLVKSDADIDALVAAAYEAAATGHVPLPMKDKFIAYTTELVSPGESAELTFVVPAPGEYTFVCLFPGHANMMFGTLRSLR